MGKSAKCKHCNHVAPNWEALQDHWQEQHNDEYVKVKKWLGNLDEKVLAADRLAKEGMKGHGNN